jgi:uncharacterized protein (TIGR03435 family)
MQRTLRLTILIGFLAIAAHGQNAPRPAFEVASIKSGGDVFSTRPDRAGGRIRWTTQVCYLIGYAYHLDFSRVSGPKCGSIYSIEATFDPAATDDQVRSMVHSLLADRFKLRTHRVTTEADGYALVIGSGGLKIREAKVPDAASAPREESYISATSPEAGVVAITARRALMSQLAETLQRVNEIPVWDRTGLSGNYDFAFRYTQLLRADSATDDPSLATALQEKLGLRLEKHKGPVDTIVIDSIAEPAEN